jgi:hypothetical protein
VAAKANFMLSPFCVSLRRPGEPEGLPATITPDECNNYFANVGYASVKR